MTTIQISNTEWQVMVVVWREGSAPSAMIRSELTAKIGWADTTVKTLLKRLVDKGALTTRRDPDNKRGYIYEATFTEEEYAASKTKSVLDRFYGGALKDMVAGFIHRDELSDEEIMELRKLLDDSMGD